jgi:hypothetical protein
MVRRFRGRRGPIYCNLSRCEPFAKEMHREKSFLVSGRVNIVIGDNFDATASECGWEPATNVPRREVVLQAYGKRPDATGWIGGRPVQDRRTGNRTS